VELSVLLRVTEVAGRCTFYEGTAARRRQLSLCVCGEAGGYLGLAEFNSALVAAAMRSAVAGGAAATAPS
jgi:hypothetical protein